MSTKKIPYGLGTIRREGPGRFVPLLPRHLSKAPPGVKNPDDYRERLEACTTWSEAYRLLMAAVAERKDNPFAVTRSLSFRLDAEEAIERLRSDVLRQHNDEARANRRVSTPKSICRHWLSSEPWWDLPTDTITVDDLQASIDHILRHGRNKHGEPISVSFVLSVAAFMRAVFDERGIKPNPAASLRLPPKKQPEVPHWGLKAQKTFFRATDDVVPLRDRVMVGCGMGAGLRIGELLSLEIDDLHTEAHDPHVIVQFGGPNHAPTKGKKARRVELFEPGLGFFRLWLKHFYRGGTRVFGGPLGGYQKHWPDQFPEWGEALSLRDSTSHIMRHSYAVAVLSGTWGYEPQSLEFVKEQLGHSDITTTQRAYGRFEQDTWRRQVQRMTGRAERPREHDMVTAEALLGLGRDWVAPPPKTSKNLSNGDESRHPPQELTSGQKQGESPEKSSGLGLSQPNSIEALAERFLELTAMGSQHAIRVGIELAERVLGETAEANDSDDSRSGVAS